MGTAAPGNLGRNPARRRHSPATRPRLITNAETTAVPPLQATTQWSMSLKPLSSGTSTSSCRCSTSRTPNPDPRRTGHATGRSSRHRRSSPDTRASATSRSWAHGVTTRAARRGTPLPTVVGTAPDPHPLQLLPGAGELADDERAAQVAGTGSHTLVRVDGTPTVGPVTAEFDVFMHGTVFLDIIFTGLPTLPAAGTEVWAKAIPITYGGVRTRMAALRGRAGCGQGRWAARLTPNLLILRRTTRGLERGRRLGSRGVQGVRWWPGAAPGSG